MAISDAELLERFPDLSVDHDNKGHYAAWLDETLVIRSCGACGTLHHPPRSICPHCWSTDLTFVPVSGLANVYLTVGLHQGPVTPEVNYEEPHTIVLADLVEQPGLRFATTYRGPRAALKIGAALSLAWEQRRGSPYPVWKLRPDV